MTAMLWLAVLKYGLLIKGSKKFGGALVQRTRVINVFKQSVTKVETGFILK